MRFTLCQGTWAYFFARNEDFPLLFFRVATTFLKKHEFYPHFHLLEEKKKIRAKIVKH